MACASVVLVVGLAAPQADAQSAACPPGYAYNPNYTYLEAGPATFYSGGSDAAIQDNYHHDVGGDLRQGNANILSGELQTREGDVLPRASHLQVLGSSYPRYCYPYYY